MKRNLKMYILNTPTKGKPHKSNGEIYFLIPEEYGNFFTVGSLNNRQLDSNVSF